MFGFQSAGVGFFGKDRRYYLGQERLVGQEAAHTSTSYTSVTLVSELSTENVNATKNVREMEK